MDSLRTIEDPLLLRLVQQDAIRDAVKESTLPHMEAIAAIISAEVTAAAQRRRREQGTQNL
jgi:hypothetical protein